MPKSRQPNLDKAVPKRNMQGNLDPSHKKYYNPLSALNNHG